MWNPSPSTFGTHLQNNPFFERLSTTVDLGFSRVTSEGKIDLIIGGKARLNWSELAVCFAASKRYILVKASRDDAEGLLEECQKLHHCVLIIDFDWVAKIDPRIFVSRVGYGRLIRVLVLVEEETPANCELLLR